MRIIFFFLFCGFWASAEPALRVEIFDSPEEVAEACSRKIARLIRTKKNCVLGLATGNTPIPTYRALVCELSDADLSQVVTFNLDEYAGLSPQDPRSFHSFMEMHLFSLLLESPQRPCGFKRENLHLPHAEATEFPLLASEAQKYESELARLGPIDLQILGIGTNGHIGFAEPGSSFENRTSLVRLTENTRRDNQSSFGSDSVPEFALTMGISTILQAKEIILLATGAKKAEIIRQLLSVPISPDLPATALRLHPNATLYLDREAAAFIGQLHAEK